MYLSGGLDSGGGDDVDDVGEGNEGRDDAVVAGLRDPSKVVLRHVDPSSQLAVESVRGLGGVLGDHGLLSKKMRMGDRLDDCLTLMLK